MFPEDSHVLQESSDFKQYNFVRHDRSWPHCCVWYWNKTESWVDIVVMVPMIFLWEETGARGSVVGW
jgi:hypothetical protein